MQRYFIIFALIIAVSIYATEGQKRAIEPLSPIVPTEQSLVPFATTTETESVVPEKKLSQPAAKKSIDSVVKKETVATVPTLPPPTPTPTEMPAPASNNGGQIGPEISVSALELRIHALINAERTAQGLTALAWQPQLLPIARAHSADMATRGYFAHNSPEGEDFLARYTKGGFACHIQIGSTIHLGAENLFQNNLYDSWSEMNGVRTYNYNSLEDIAASTVRGWMNSPGHRQNILTPYWETEAIGISIATNDQILITENFC